ncbi:MAG: hypothetical protein KF777_24950 [Planctomycetaceae bacterium]|nr:hypothetical protein [Planctomycetaceae bacterium]
MRVNPKDGTCRGCGGELTIIDADDATMTVECERCGDVYLVETDAFGDGCMTYYAEFLIGQTLPAARRYDDGSASDAD